MKRLADAYRSLEPTICDISAMSQIAASQVEDLLQSIASGQKLESADHDRVLFAVFHLEKMIGSMKRDWYSNFDGGNRERNPRP